MTTEQNQEESTSDIEKVIARIQKLLSRSSTDRGSSEAEADTAMKMAQELMMKHNLDMAYIQAASASKDPNAAPVERVKEEMKGKAMYTWQRQLAKYVAEANFCYHVLQKSSEWQEGYYKLDADAEQAYPNLPKKVLRAEMDSTSASDGDLKAKYKLSDEDVERITYSNYTYQSGRYKTTHKHLFVGRKGNVITAQLMYDYLTQAIEDLVPVTDNKQRLSRSAMSWKEGCADRLCERLSARRQDLIKAHDARVKQEEADRQAARDAAAKEAREKQARQLTADRDTEVKSKFEGIANDAYEADAPDVPEDPERPEIDEDAEPWQPDAPEMPEPETGTALVLASVYDESEREANWELAHGYEPGTLARYRAEREERERKAAEEQAKTQMDQADAPVKQETERQRKAREKREAEEQMKRRRRWAREDARAEARAAKEWAKRDHRAYYAGAEKGGSIGLDLQVKAGKDTKKLS